MSAPTMTTVARMTREDAQVLAHYSQGETSRQIATALKMELEEVGTVLDSLAGNNRELALELTTAWQARAKTVAASRPVSASPDPRPTPLVRQAPVPAATTVSVPGLVPVEENIDGIADLLDAAQASGSPKLERAALRIRDLISVLQEDLAEHSRDARLRQEQADLEARLAEIKKQLRPQRQATPVSPAPNSSVAVDTKAVRVWAAENGHEVTGFGRIPASVLEAYREAVQAA